MHGILFFPANLEPLEAKVTQFKDNLVYVLKV